LRRALSAAVPTLVQRFVLFYEYVDDVVEKRGPYRADHIGLVREFVDRKECVAGGAFADPVDGAMIVFTSRKAAEVFEASDPYVANGIVTTSNIREWSTVSFE